MYGHHVVMYTGDLLCVMTVHVSGALYSAKAAAVCLATADEPDCRTLHIKWVRL